MRNDLRENEVHRHVEAEQLGYLEDAVGNAGFFIQNVLVDHAGQDLLNVGLDAIFDADYQAVQLVEDLLLQVGLERELVQISEDLFNELVCVLANDVSRCFAGWVFAEIVDLNLHGNFQKSLSLII